MSRLLNYFFKGLIVIAPVFITVYVCYLIFTRIDSWLGLPVRGVGFVITVALIVLVGFVAQTFLSRTMIGALDRIFDRLPFARLLYSSTKDLLNAFVGEHRRFDKPVLVTLQAGGNAKAFGFLTQGTLARFGLSDHVAVYIPQSYGFAGNMLVFPVAQVQHLDAESPAVMAFILSGGVTSLPTAD
jgi:uncharacterized membrane protein